MAAVSRAWNAICRFVAARSQTAAPADPAYGRAQRTRGRDSTLRTLRIGSRRLYRWCTRFRGWMHEAQRNSDRVRQEAMRNERRARRKALILLLRQMNPEQRQEFRKYRYFHVIGGSSGDGYRIRADMIANIDVLRKDGTVKYRLCVRPTGDIPVYDVMAAQLLHLQDAGTEQRFVQHANILSTLPEDQVCLRTTWLA